MEEPDFRFIYYKQANALKRELVSTFNSGSRGSCNEFVRRYSTLQFQIQQNIINKIAKSRSGRHSLDRALELPYVAPTDHPQGKIESADKLNELIMATSQMMSLLAGLGGSFEKELEDLKKENIRIKDELKKVKPLFPPEVISKVPGKLQKTINEANVSYNNSQWTATGLLLRKIIENALHLKCKRENCEDILKDNETNEFFELPKKIDVCKGRGIIKSNRARDLKKIKLYGDSAAHSLSIELTSQDIEEAKAPARLLLEELFS